MGYCRHLSPDPLEVEGDDLFIGNRLQLFAPRGLAFDLLVDHPCFGQSGDPIGLSQGFDEGAPGLSVVDPDVVGPGLRVAPAEDECLLIVVDQLSVLVDQLGFLLPGLSLLLGVSGGADRGLEVLRLEARGCR